MSAASELESQNTRAIQENTRAIQSEYERATQVEAGKVDKIEGKGLSTNDYTDEDKRTVTNLKNSVTSVNDVKPDENGNVFLEKVPFADNIYSSDMTIDEPSDGFIFRAAGGDASITNGNAFLKKLYGNIGYVADMLVAAKPVSFIAKGFNQFNPTDVIGGFATIEDGMIVTDVRAMYKVAFVKVAGDLSKGYTVHAKAGAVKYVGWCANAPSLGTSVQMVNLAATEDSTVEGCSNYQFIELANGGLFEDGYFAIVTTDLNMLCVHPHWSGPSNWRDEELEDYTEYSASTVIIPSVDIGGTAIPTGTYGMAAVGDVRDELDFDAQVFHKRIGRLDYTPANMSFVNQYGTRYETDRVATIFYVLKDEDAVDYQLPASTSGLYTVCDYGTEEFSGSEINVKVSIVYLPNLRDKLRTDVVTISEMSLTEHKKEQVRKNIGAAADDETVKSVNGTVPDSSGDVQIKKVEYAENLYSSDNTSDTSAFIVRTSGGDASINNGMATLARVEGSISVDADTTEISISKPTQFKSIGFNAFNSETMIIAGYNNFGSDGKIYFDSDHADYKLCHVRMPVSDSRGWQIYNPDGRVVKVGWCSEIPTLASTITELAKDDILSEAKNDVYVAEENGYLVIVTSDVETLCVHPRWSGKNNWGDAEGFRDYEPYTDSIIEIPTESVDGDELPTASYGMPGIGDICDMLNLLTKQYIKKIGYLPFSDANLEYAQSQSDTVIYDEAKILYVLRDYVTYNVDISSSYEVCDYGTEMFEGEIYAPLKTGIVYGDNLRDKLRTDVVTYSNQAALEKSDSQKAQARKNIGAASDSEVVKSINGQKPESNGELSLNEVPYANNLISSDNQEVRSSFIFRTAGGDASITNGDAHLSYVRGVANIPQHIPESLTFAFSEESRLNPEVDLNAWVAGRFGSEAGEYVFNYVGTRWTYTDRSGDKPVQSDIDLSTIGITTQNYAMDGDSLKAVYTITQADETTLRNVSVTASERQHFSVLFDGDVFKSLISDSGQYKFIYEAGEWNLYKLYNNSWLFDDNNPVVPLDYGITVNGTPIDNDTVLIKYTEKYDETLSIIQPTAFRAIGFNQFNKGSEQFPNAQYIEGYAIDASGNVVESEGSYVAWVHVVGGLANGYQIYNGTVSLDRVCWTSEIPTASTAGMTVLEENTALSEDAVEGGAGNKLIKDYQFDEDGYLAISTTSIDGLCVHPRWSGTVNWRDSEGLNDYEDYEEYTIPVPLVAIDNSGDEPVEVTLPTGVYGIPSIGNVKDELNFGNLTYTQNISSIEYTPQNISDVVSMGVPYSYDSERILFALQSPRKYRLGEEYADLFTVCDYGIEEFLGSNIPFDVECAVLYGQSLKDKLRTDVVTVSEQQLSDSEKAQIGYNVGTRYNLVSRELQSSIVTIGGTDIDCYVASVDDYAITTVEIDRNDKPVFIYLPPKAKDGRARDFIVRLAVTVSEPPQVAFYGYNNEVVDYESTDEEWATVEAGSNLFSFTEMASASN